MRTQRRTILVFLLLCVWWVSGCGGAEPTSDGGAQPITSTPVASEPATAARRAAAQLEVEAVPGAGGGPFEGRELDPPLVTPDFALTTTDGRSFDFRRDATAAVTLLYFGYTGCPDVCPTHLAAIASARSRLPAAITDDIQVLFVSVDTVNDSTERLADYLGNFGDDIVGLTGSAADINAALVSVGLPPTAIASAEQFPPEHPSAVLAYTADGRAHVAYPFGTPPDAFEADLRRLHARDWSS